MIRPSVSIFPWLDNDVVTTAIIVVWAVLFGILGLYRQSAREHRPLRANDVFVWLYRGITSATSIILLVALCASFAGGGDIDVFLTNNKALLVIVSLVAGLSTISDFSSGRHAGDVGAEIGRHG